MFHCVSRETLTFAYRERQVKETNEKAKASFAFASSLSFVKLILSMFNFLSSLKNLVFFEVNKIFASLLFLSRVEMQFFKPLRKSIKRSFTLFFKI